MKSWIEHMIEIYRALAAVVNSEGALVTSPWETMKDGTFTSHWMLGKATGAWL